MNAETAARLPYRVERARFATFPLALAYAQFLADDSGQEQEVDKYGIVVAHVAPELGVVA